VFRLLWRRHAGHPEGYTEADVLAALADVGGPELAALADDRVAQPQLPQLGDDVVAAVGLTWVPDGKPTVPDLGVHATEDDRGVTVAAALRDRPAWRGG
jgi:predicted metalloprotease with PDZ domain